MTTYTTEKIRTAGSSISYFQGICKPSLRTDAPSPCRFSTHRVGIILHGVVVTDKDILKQNHTVLIGGSRLVDSRTGDGSTGQAESHTGHEAILGSLRDFQITASQLILELGFSGGVVLNDNTSLNFRNHILCSGIDFLKFVVLTNGNVVESGNAVRIGSSGHVHGRTGGGSAGQPVRP